MFSNKRGPLTIAVLVLTLVAIWYRWPETPPPLDLSGPTAEWPEWGNDAGGQRFSPLTQITRENVRFLEMVWEHHSGDVSGGGGDIPSTTAYQLTPILVDGTLYGCSPFNRVFALDPETGEEIWSFDPESDLANTRPANQWVCRGVAHWLEPELAQGQQPGESSACRRRIYTATNDARLIALDSATGELCHGFGDGGQVDLTRGVGSFWWKGEYQVTSAPTVINDLVVVGSAVSDNARVDAPSGVVRAYDARSGEMRWAWDPVTPEYRERHPEGTPEGDDFFLGTPNVWGVMSADAERDLLFLPTGNSSPDYYGGHRDGIDEYGSSVIALRASTGEVVWYYQTVHHDLWDYDVAAQPTLTTVVRDGQQVPAVVVATKMGLIFVLHRETGAPLFPVEERAVPQDGVAGELLSPTQPFPVKPPPLIPHDLSPDRAFGLTPWGRNECRAWIESLRFDGIYTPPSLQGSLMYPGNIGGSNWGGVAVDPVRGIAVANVTDLPFAVRLFPADEYEREREANPGLEVSPQRGTPYGMIRVPLVSPLQVPCVKPPWGTLLAVDLVTGEVRWRETLSLILDIGPVRVRMGVGFPTIGGSLITESGIIFMDTGVDQHLRAIDIATGEELWAGRLPAGGQANPMTYRLHENGRQFVVIAAGGHGRMGTILGDSLVAFALPESRTSVFTSVAGTLLYVGLGLLGVFLLIRFGRYVFSTWLRFPLLVVFVILSTETAWLMTQSIAAMAFSFGLALVLACLLMRSRKHILRRRRV